MSEKEQKTEDFTSIYTHTPEKQKIILYYIEHVSGDAKKMYYIEPKSF